MTTVEWDSLYVNLYQPACLPAVLFSPINLSRVDALVVGHTVVQVQEMSQRDPGGPVQSCIARAEANLRLLLDIPDNYKVLFFQVAELADFFCP